jgi:hypothetical protein
MLRNTVPHYNLNCVDAEDVSLMNVTKSIEDCGSWKDRRAKCLMLWYLYRFSVLVLIEVVVDIVFLRRGQTVHIVIPIADSVKLVKHSSVGAEEAELLSRGQTPVPDLRNKTGLVDRLTYIVDLAELPTHKKIKVTWRSSLWRWRQQAPLKRQ